MSCLEVRDRLAEHVLGVLPPSEDRVVERHLEWCAGCRKEAEELREGAATVVLSLPAVPPPPPSLESRVVDKLQVASGRRKQVSRGPFRALVVATLAAVLVALGAVAWAVNERNQAQDARASLIDRVQRLESFFAGNSAAYQATLHPTGVGAGRSSSAQDGGKALIYNAPNAPDIILVDVYLAPPQSGPYTFQLLGPSGKPISGAELRKTNAGDWTFFELSGADLSKGITLTVKDRAGQAVLFGVVQRTSSR